MRGLTRGLFTARRVALGLWGNRLNLLCTEGAFLFKAFSSPRRDPGSAPSYVAIAASESHPCAPAELSTKSAALIPPDGDRAARAVLGRRRCNIRAGKQRDLSSLAACRLSLIDRLRMPLFSMTVAAVFVTFWADVLPGETVRQTDVDLDTYAKTEVISDRVVRHVWVLAPSQSMSEVGPLAGSPEIIIYESECIGGRLGSVIRADSAHPEYGSPSWAVRLDHPILSGDGASALRGALQSLCQGH